MPRILLSSGKLIDFLEHEEFKESEGMKFVFPLSGFQANSGNMNTLEGSDACERCFNWREDLANSRDLQRREIEGYGYVLSWIEDWRIKEGLPPGRAAAKRWWREVAKSKDRPEWQFRQWTEAIR